MLGDKLGKKYRIRIINLVHDMIDLAYSLALPVWHCYGLKHIKTAAIDSF